MKTSTKIYTIFTLLLFPTFLLCQDDIILEGPTPKITISTTDTANLLKLFMESEETGDRWSMTGDLDPTPRIGWFYNGSARVVYHETDRNLKVNGALEVTKDVNALDGIVNVHKLGVGGWNSGLTGGLYSDLDFYLQGDNTAINFWGINSGTEEAFIKYDDDNMGGNSGDLVLQNTQAAGDIIFRTEGPASDDMRLTSAGLLDVNGDIDASGTVTASCGILTCSDIRYKTNINPIGNALEKLNRINGVTYDWDLNKHPTMGFDSRKQIGVLAQEVEKVFPELVHERPDGYKVVAYDGLAPILLEALKEQQVMIDQLRKEVDELRQR